MRIAILLLSSVISFSSASSSPPLEQGDSPVEGTGQLFCENFSLLTDYFCVPQPVEPTEKTRPRAFSSWEQVRNDSDDDSDFSDEDRRSEANRIDAILRAELERVSLASRATEIDLNSSDDEEDEAASEAVSVVEDNSVESAEPNGIKAALRELDRILTLTDKDTSLLSLKGWLNTQCPWQAKVCLMSRSLRLTPIAIQFDFESNLVKTLLQIFGADDSMEHWLEVLRFVDSCISCERVEAVAVVIQHVISVLKKGHQHIIALFFRIFGERYDNEIDCLRGHLDRFEGWERLFTSLMRGDYNRWEWRRLFFFAREVQMQVVASYLSSKGKIFYRGIIEYDLLVQAMEYKLDFAVFEMILVAAEGHERLSLGRALSVAFDLKAVECAEAIISKYPEAAQLLAGILEKAPFEVVSSHPFWLNSLPVSGGDYLNFPHLLTGEFDAMELVLLARMQADPFFRESLMRTFLASWKRKSGKTFSSNFLFHRKQAFECINLLLEHSFDQEELVLVRLAVEALYRYCMSMLVEMLKEAILTQRIHVARVLVNAGIKLPNGIVDEAVSLSIHRNAHLEALFDAEREVVEDYNI